MAEMRTPVLIAGGGASGTFLALLLAQHGIASIVAEAREGPYHFPRAHALNPRTLEICHSLGLDMAQMKRQSAGREEAGRVYFVTRLLGPVFGSLPYERQDDGVYEFTPFPLINLPQTEFEEILFAAAARQPLIRFRRDWRWEAFEREGEEIASQLVTQKGNIVVRSRYLVGCDGAGSSVRTALDIGMRGDPAVLSVISITFRADLRAPLADRPGLLYWCNDPAATGTFIAYHMDRLWSFAQMHPPGRIDMTAYDNDSCRKIVLDAIGAEVEGLEVVGANPWKMTSQVADRYSEGNVFLLGDAAHRFPPTGGLGLNTGIQDAHNLAWKIAAVERGIGSHALLETYESERHPVATRNADQSLLNAKRLAVLSELRCEREVWGDPKRFEVWLAEGERHARIRDAIALQTDHFDSFGLQLGYSYGADRDLPFACSKYEPSAKEGHRLPHAWLAHSVREVSTLDLLDPTRFTAFAEAGAERLPDTGLLKVVRLSQPPIPEEWREVLGLPRGGVLVVRPDGHISYRGLVEGVSDALRNLLIGTSEDARDRTGDRRTS